jgi:hypothetical protein
VACSGTPLGFLSILLWLFLPPSDIFFPSLLISVHYSFFLPFHIWHSQPSDVKNRCRS